MVIRCKSYKIFEYIFIFNYKLALFVDELIYIYIHIYNKLT